MKVKVCGITSYKQFIGATKAGADYAGFIFHEPSARCIPADINASAIAEYDGTVKKIGVFVNVEEEKIREKIKAFNLNAIQLHGNESNEFCRRFTSDIEVVKAISVRESENDFIAQIEYYEHCCHYFLFDTASPGYGGTGRKFSWSKLNRDITKPFFLSGGIGLEDADAIADFFHPAMFAVDINSRFEVYPGIKDMEKVKLFIEKINELK